MLQAGNFQQAFPLFYNRLASLLYHRLGAYQLVIELLQGFFSSEDTPTPELEKDQQSWLLDALANAYSASGYPQRAIHLLQTSIAFDQEEGDRESIADWNLAVQQLMLGDFVGAEKSLEASIAVCTAISDKYNAIKTHQYFALLRAYQGMFESSWHHLEQTFLLMQVQETPTLASSLWAYQALCQTLAGELDQALKASEQALQLANVLHYERDIVRAEWLMGSTLTRLAERKSENSQEQLQNANTFLTDALERCRHIDMVDYEGDLLFAWARFYRAQRNQQQAKKACLDALAISNRSDFRPLRADILNCLAQIALEEGNQKVARDYVQAAIKDAQCPSMPYYYQSAFDLAESLLEQASSIS